MLYIAKKTTTDTDATTSSDLASNSFDSKDKQTSKKTDTTQDKMENDDDDGFQVNLEPENENSLNQDELNTTLINGNYRDIIDKVRTVVKIFLKILCKN